MSLELRVQRLETQATGGAGLVTVAAFIIAVHRSQAATDAGQAPARADAATMERFAAQNPLLFAAVEVPPCP